MDAKTIKIAYVVPAFLAMLGAIAAAYFHEQYVALGLIVLASAIILGGSLLVTYAFKMETARGRKRP
jgi:uncharacterized membrane-anchored protein